MTNSKTMKHRVNVIQLDKPNKNEPNKNKTSKMVPKVKAEKKVNVKENQKNRTFKKNDYLSGDGMLTSVWGPSMWHYLHIMSFNYPVAPTTEDKNNYRNFVLNLQNVLPCKYCRMNLKTNFKQMPLKMSCMQSREIFSKYIYDLHELVNKLLNKKSNLSYADVRERYEHFRSRCTEEKPKLFKVIKANAKNKTMKNKSKSKKEKGCTEPLYGKKSKCIIKIVPQEEKTDTFQMDKKCVKMRGSAPARPLASL